MNIKIKKFIFSLSLGATTLFVSANGAKAAYFSSMSGSTATDLNFTEEFNASSYIGDDGGSFSELEIGDINPPTSTQGQYSWESGQEVSFELSFDGTNLDYTVGDETIQSLSLNVMEEDFDVNGMIISANSTDNSSAELKNLMFNDGAMGMEDLTSDGAEADLLKVTGIDNTFTLTGTQVFTWEGERPENLDLAYQIRVGNFQSPLATSALAAETEIPEPATVSLFSLGVIALGLKCRRRQ